MGRKTLLAAALAAALAGLAACGTTRVTGVSDGPGAGQVASAAHPTTTSPAGQQAAATGRLPAGITSVKITLVPGLNDKTKPPGPVTVTSESKVGDLVALINGQPPSPSGPVHSCPMDDGRGVQLTFLGGPGGPALASAFAAGNGCGGVTLTIGASKSTLGSGTGPAARALAIAGIRWNLSGPA
jgi:hypothetical protein